MLYVQCVNPHTTDPDTVQGTADIPSKALDIFEDSCHYSDEYEYDRTEAHQRLCDGEDIRIEGTIGDDSYVLIARP